MKTNKKAQDLAGLKPTTFFPHFFRSVTNSGVMNDSVELSESVGLIDCNAIVNWFEWAVEGVLIFVVGNIGLLGNCISIW